MGDWFSHVRPNSDEADEDMVNLFRRLVISRALTKTSLHILLSSRPHFMRRVFRRVNTRTKEKSFVRVLSWNMLAQALGEADYQFPPGNRTLDWPQRRFYLLHEIVQHQPDIICLQEVDHFCFLKATLGAVGYVGHFMKKPSSPCLNVPNNNGPDGVAIFYNAAKFDWISWKTRVLSRWKIRTNEIVLGGVLRARSNNVEIFCAVTQLKGDSSFLSRIIRDIDGQDLLEWVREEASERPIILCGYFNCQPSDPMYQNVMRDRLNLRSAYRINGNEPEYTFWKAQNNKEYKKTVDYIFHSKSLIPLQVMEIPDSKDVCPERFPNESYPSNHLALIVDFGLNMFYVKRRHYRETAL